MDSKLNLIELHNTPIFEQLQLEEALLRTSDENFLILNHGSPPAIVMGISGKPNELIDLENNHLPIIKRFSGGGTVVIDENTLFTTFIFNSDTHPFAPFSEPILKWSADLFASIIPNLALRAQDYTIENLKIGGNAQYIRKNRWLHHTSFLWNYDPALMNLLLTPKKQPSYRQNRPHSDFITTLPLPEKLSLFTKLKQTIHSRYQTTSTPPPTHFSPHRTSTKVL